MSKKSLLVSAALGAVLLIGGGTAFAAETPAPTPSVGPTATTAPTRSATVPTPVPTARPAQPVRGHASFTG